MCMHTILKQTELDCHLWLLSSAHVSYYYQLRLSHALLPYSASVHTCLPTYTRTKDKTNILNKNTQNNNVHGCLCVWKSATCQVWSELRVERDGDICDFDEIVRMCPLPWELSLSVRNVPIVVVLSTAAVMDVGSVCDWSAVLGVTMNGKTPWAAKCKNYSSTTNCDGKESSL
jgi:hypothetical protein